MSDDSSFEESLHDEIYEVDVEIAEAKVSSRPKWMLPALSVFAVIGIALGAVALLGGGGSEVDIAATDDVAQDAPDLTSTLSLIHISEPTRPY